MAYQFSGAYQEAEDLTQEIFLKLFNSLAKYDKNKNFTAWLLTLAKNHLIDQYRKTKRERKERDDFDEHLLAAGAQSDPEKNVLRKETQEKVWKGLNSLSAEVRMTLILRDIQGKSYEEIAGILSLPSGTVKSRVNRGRLQLAKILREKEAKKNGL